MGLRLRSIRQKILLLVLVPVLSLIGLYIFALGLTARNAINLSRTNTLKNATAVPAGNFITALEAERVLALIYLSRSTGANLAGLENAESKTATTVTAMRLPRREAGHRGAARRRGPAALAAQPDPRPDHHPQPGVRRLQRPGRGRLRAAAAGRAAGNEHDGGHPVAGHPA